MKMIKKWFCALAAALLMLGAFGAVSAEAASLIRSTQPYYNYLADCDAELFGGFKIQTSYPNSELTRSGGGKEYAIIAQQSGRAINGVANDTTVLYSLYEKNVLSIWKANISTLKKTQVAKISVKAKEAELCAYYNNTVYYRATSKKGAKLLFSYPLSTKVSKKIGSGVYPCAQVSGFLVYTRDKLDGSEGAYLKCYNIKTKKSVSMDNAAESVRRWGKYIYYSRYGENIYKVANMTARVPSLEVIRYDLDTNQKTTLLNIDRHGASVARITGEGVYHRTPDDAYGKYTDFATEDTRDAEPFEISGI